MKRVLAAVACLAALASTPAMSGWFDAFTGRWMLSASRDAITDEVVTVAHIQTTEVNQRIGYEEARVSLVCIGGRSAIIIDWTFRVAGKANLSIEYRFEGLPGREIEVRYVNRNRQSSEDRESIRQFLADASLSDKVYLRISSDAYGVSDAEFRTRGGAEMVQQFAAVCPDAVAGPRG